MGGEVTFIFVCYNIIYLNINLRGKTHVLLSHVILVHSIVCTIKNCVSTLAKYSIL